MNRFFKSGKVNVRFLVILAVAVILIGGLGYGGLKLRRHYVVSRALKTGLAAYEKGDWQEARKNLGIYLSKRPESSEILEKYAVAQLSVEPVEPSSIGQAINAYRRLMRLEPENEKSYRELARLYLGVGDYGELSYIARKRLEQRPEDVDAKLWLTKAMMGQNKGEEAVPVLLSVVEALEQRAEKQESYVEACELLSHLAMLEKGTDSWAKALDWLNRAVAYNPEWPKALATRAKFYRLASGGDLDAAERMKRAKADLDRADSLTIDDPRLRLVLSMEWLMQGDYGRAGAELTAVDEIDRAGLREYFLDPADWEVASFTQRAELAIRTGELKEGMVRADAVLAALTGRYQRLRALPSAILLYSYGGKVGEARKYLNEYQDIIHRLDSNPEPAVKVAYLQALVAEAEGHPYRAIEYLEPILATNSSNTMILRLLADAYSRTDQPRRAVRIIDQYLRYQPGDQQMRMQLMGEYLKLKQFDKALVVAKQTDASDSIDMVIRFLGLELGHYGEGGVSAEGREKGLDAIALELGQLRTKHPKKVEIRLLQANLAVQKGDIGEAERILNEAIKECSNPWPAELQLSRLYGGSKRMKEALAVLAGACQREETLGASWEAMSELQALSGQVAESRKTLEAGIAAVTSVTEKRNLRTRLAGLEIVQGNRETGIAMIKALAAEDKQDVKVRTLLLDLPEIRADKAAAQTLTDELKEIEGESGLFWRVAQASLWMGEDDWRARQQEIMNALQRCIDGDPGWSAPVLLMGQMYERLGDLQKAESLYRKGLYENTSALAVADRLIALLEKQKRYSEVMKVLEQVDSGGRALNERKTVAAIKAGDIGRAIEELKLKIANDAKDVNSRVLLARLYYSETKDAVGAFAYLDEAEKLAKESLTVKAARVAILREENRTDEAKRILDAEVASGKSIQAYLLRAGFFVSLGQPDLAEKDYRAMLPLSQKGEGYDVLTHFYINAKRYDEAVRTLEAGVKAFPEALSLQRGLMKALLLRNGDGDRSRAVAMLEKMETDLPDDSDLMWVRAVQLFDEGSDASIRKGQEILAKVIELNPNAVDAYLGLISLAVREGDIDRAREMVIRALGANPSDSRLLLARAGIERRLNNPGLALEAARLVLKGDPQNTEARNLFVNTAILARDAAALKEAESMVKNGLKAKPEDESLHLLNAMVLDVLGRRDEAVTTLKAFGRTEAGKASLQTALALTELCRMNQDLAGMEEWLEQAASLEPENSVVLRERILRLAGQRKYAEIKTFIDEYRTRSTRDVGVLMAAASSLAGSENPVYLKDAAELFDAVAKAAPKVVQAKKGLAQVKYMLGEVDRSEQLYREVLEAEPNNVEALNDLAWLLGETKHRYEDALKLAEQGMKLNPDDVHLLDTYATICQNLPDRLQDAKKGFEKCVALEAPGSVRQARAYYKLGKVWLKLDSKPKAKECYESALKIDGAVKAFGEKERREMAELLK
jgi:tetratricopeptide (TPR) repeat protein